MRPGQWKCRKRRAASKKVTHLVGDAGDGKVDAAQNGQRKVHHAEAAGRRGSFRGMVRLVWGECARGEIKTHCSWRTMGASLPLLPVTAAGVAAMGTLVWP